MMGFSGGCLGGSQLLEQPCSREQSAGLFGSRGTRLAGSAQAPFVRSSLPTLLGIRLRETHVNRDGARCELGS